MQFSRQEYCNALPFSPPGYLPDLGIEPTSLMSPALQAGSLPLSPGGSDGTASACSAGDSGSIPGLERSLEKEMATHSSTLAWKIPWTEEPGRLQSVR